MNLMEQQNQTEKREAYLNEKIAERYESIEIEGSDRKTFLKPSGTVFRLDWFLMNKEDGFVIVVEFAENTDEAKINRFEDGKVFYVNEMTEEEMLQAVIEEIEA